MKPSQILKQTLHRPFKFPQYPWKYYQEWNNAIFLHWKVDPNLISPYLPKHIELDCIDGRTWISLVAFDMNNIRIKNLPKPPYISNFHEINIRVYIKYKGKPGVYFLSMEGSKRLSCAVLKIASKFPYRYSKMQRTDSHYFSENLVFNDSFKIEFNLNNDIITKDKIDIWLTERYAVFQDYKKDIIEYDVHHIEWPMQKITVKNLAVNYPRFNHLINSAPDKIHYSSGVQVLAWSKNKHPL